MEMLYKLLRPLRYIMYWCDIQSMLQISASVLKENAESSKSIKQLLLQTLLS